MNQEYLKEIEKRIHIPNFCKEYEYFLIEKYAQEIVPDKKEELFQKIQEITI